MWCLAPRTPRAEGKRWLVSNSPRESLGEPGVGVLGGFLEEVALDLRLNGSKSSRRTNTVGRREALKYEMSHFVDGEGTKVLCCMLKPFPHPLISLEF